MSKKMYFANCESDGDVMIAFCNYAKKAKASEAEEIAKQFKPAWLRCRDFSRNLQGKIYEEKNEVTANDMLKVLTGLMSMKNIRLSIVGDWIWVIPKSEEVCDELFELGLAHKKNSPKWYWNKRAAVNFKNARIKAEKAAKRKAEKAAKAKKKSA